MLGLHKILVPTDFSPGSRSAYKFANLLSRHLGGTIDLLHVIPAFQYLSESVKHLGLPLDMDKDVYPHLVEDAEHKTENDLRDYIGYEYQGKPITLIETKVSDTIAKFAKRNHYDLVIMGAKGKHENSFMRGSITEKVIRHSSVPVLSVPKAVPQNGIHNIVTPIDLSETSFSSLLFTLTLCARFDCTLHLLHILEIHGSLSENEPRIPGKAESDSIRATLMDRLISHINKQTIMEAEVVSNDEDGISISLFNDAERHIIPVKIVVQRGVSAHYVINDYAQDHADFIVMTTHGRSGLSHLLLGSTTEKVVQHSTLPVLTFRPERFSL